MYDIYDDELNEMYESTGKTGITLDKGISPSDPLSTLTQEKFIVLNEQATLRDAIDSMQKYHIGCILLDNNHKITGIFTERDIVQHIVGNRHNLDK